MRVAPTPTRPEWIVPEPLPAGSDVRSLDADPLVAAILYRRGIRTRQDADAFMQPTRAEALDPFCLPNMRAALERVVLAIHRGERIGVFGDYDADGVTATAIMVQALGHALEPDRIVARLPERSEGYGMNPAAIAEFAAAGASLVIAVDCGSSDHESAAALANLGIDLVILDHHQMRDQGPETAITVSPQLDADPTCHHLTAAGVVYLLVCAIESRGIRVSGGDGGAAAYLDLVALGTVADVAPLTGVNRPLVARGLELIRTKPRAGVAALIDAAGLQADRITATDISFALSPRINAAGRVGTPALAFDLLMATNRLDARRLALELNELNLRRRVRSNQLLAEARALLALDHEWPSRPLVALQHPDWDGGLIGAVASRLVSEVRRPVFLFQERDGVLSGSARSVDGIDLVDALEGVEPLLHRFGGHSLAAGLSLDAANLEAVTGHLAAAVRATGVPVPAPKRLSIDATLPPSYLTLETVGALARMEPFGRGNEQPLLRIADTQLLKYSTMGQDRSHLKLFLKTGNRQVEAICWGAADRSRELVGTRQVDLVGRLERNTWNGQDRLQVIVEDFRAS